MVNDIVSLIGEYRYLVVFPLAIVEGPLTTVISGFFVSKGELNILATYCVLMAGDIIGDTIVYGIGRFGGRPLVKKIGKWFKVTDEGMNQAEAYFQKHGLKHVTISKIVHGIGLAGLITAGSMRVKYAHYVAICFITTTLQAAVLLTIGIIAGHAFTEIEGYLNGYAALGSAVVIAVVLVLLFNKARKLVSYK